MVLSLVYRQNGFRAITLVLGDQFLNLNKKDHCHRIKIGMELGHCRPTCTRLQTRGHKVQKLMLWFLYVDTG
jgi:hypothetical protein